jgi:3-hydroxyacyl-CoA dehydrogenase / enoyl-CoA hydratase / 3-hydroxybutyryl-CoA epimerase
VHVMEQTRADLAAEGRRWAPGAGEALVERMVKEFGRAGRAAGGGFYDYPAQGPKRLWPGLKQHFEKPGLEVSVPVLKQRLLYRQAIETARCLAENVLTSVHEANIGSIFGIGFPAWTGGAIQFVASEGLENFLRNSDALALQHGDRFTLSSTVRERLRQAFA